MGKIRCLILDVDGTLTDGKVNISDSGELFKSFDIKDGYAIKNILTQFGILPVVITARTSNITQIRCEELNIAHCYQGVADKLAFVENQLLQELNLTLDNIAYVGDDLPDLPCMKQCAVKGCPADAVKEVKELCDFISVKTGGNGAVREFVEWMIQWNG